MNEQNDLLGVNYRVLLHNFAGLAKRLIWPVLVLTALVGGLQYYRAERSYQPRYSSSVVFSVKATYSATTDITGSSPYLDSNAALMLSQTFPYIIQSENAQQLLLAELGTATIPGTISATSTADAGLFTMTATCRSPQDAYDLMLAAIAVYPQAASNILGDTQINVINQPLAPPDEPDNPNNSVTSALLYALPVLALGIAGIFLLSLTRKTVHSAEDLRRLVNPKCLGYVPAVKLKKHSDQANLTVTITNPRVGSGFRESIRSLRVKVQKLLDAQNAQILLVTSTIPGEGKTTVATNLALALAAEEKRVILIDGDLRMQSLKHTIGISQSSDGLVEILSGKASNFRLLRVPNSTLLVLSGDETTDQPQPLLDTQSLRRTLDALRDRLDYIIIDTPPAGILSDAATIAKYADAVLYVVRQDHASTAQILNSVQSLFAGSANIIGCVLNHTIAGTTRYGYGSKHSNGYGYSYGYKYTYGYGRKRSRKKEEEELENLSRSITQSASNSSDVEKDRKLP